MARPSAAPQRDHHASLAIPLQLAANEIRRASAGIRSLADCPTLEQQQLTHAQVIVSLATLQSAVSDLSRAYINHANTVLNRGPVSMETSLSTGLAGGLTSSLLENGLLGGAVAHHAIAQDSLNEKKKRKRAPHDPNAPKRALTPYFLYMQHNRSQIADELGPDAKPKDVADEGTRRWSTMKDEDKEVWKKLYSQNLAVYKTKMEAYKANKAGHPLPEDDDLAKADSQLQQSIAEAEAEDSSDSESESSDEEPAKEPTPPPSNKRRRGNAGTAKAPAAPVSPVVTKKSSPEKKQKTPVAKKDITPASKQVDSAAGKSHKKKRKSEAGTQN